MPQGRNFPGASLYGAGSGGIGIERAHSHDGPVPRSRSEMGLIFTVKLGLIPNRGYLSAVRALACPFSHFSQARTVSEHLPDRRIQITSYPVQFSQNSPEYCSAGTLLLQAYRYNLVINIAS